MFILGTAGAPGKRALCVYGISVKEAAPHSLLLIYILHIDLIRNVMHNIHTRQAVSYFDIYIVYTLGI